MASIAGYDLEPGLGFYSVTKTTLIALSKVLSKELMNDKIRVNCVAPVNKSSLYNKGVIKTQFSRLLWEGKE